MTCVNKGAVDKPIPRVAHGGAIAPLEHVGSPRCSAVNSSCQCFFIFHNIYPL